MLSMLEKARGEQDATDTDDQTMQRSALEQSAHDFVTSLKHAAGARLPETADAAGAELAEFRVDCIAPPL